MAAVTQHDDKSPGVGGESGRKPYKVTILAASPRKGGNCDAIARLCKRAFEDDGAVVSLLHLREFEIRPCVSCGACQETDAGLSRLTPEWRTDFGCPLGRADDVPKLLGKLLDADRILVISPIYFYHLPALFKALLDRMQPFWSEDAVGAHSPEPAAKPCGVILIAGRKTGAKLFEGSLLTLKYSLANLNVFLDDPLLLRGLDGPGDLENSPECQRLVDAYARKQSGGLVSES